MSSSAAGSSGTSIASKIFAFVFHLDTHLAALVAAKGAWAYAVLMGIVFAETGLVLTPLLPGDSLLFAAGAVCGMGSLDVRLLILGLVTAAVLGDFVNYSAGRVLGSAAFERFPRVFKPEYLQRTRSFYAKYGGKTVVLARFIPIVRTFAPFVAGVGAMDRARFALYNVVGAILWTVSFTLAGFFFGGLPFVQKNFSAVIFAIVGISLVPVVAEVLQQRQSPVSHSTPGMDNEQPIALSSHDASKEERQRDRRQWIDHWKRELRPSSS